MPESVFNLPLWIVGLFTVAILCGFALLGLEVARRLVLPRLRVSAEDSEFNGTMVQSIMVFYGLAVALIAVSVWETHSAVSDTVSLEASRLAELYRDSGSYPEPLRSELRAELEAYVDHVIDVEWAEMHDGRHPTGGVGWINRFQATMETFQPRSEAEKILHAEALHAYNRLIESRRLRLDAMLVKLAGVLWFVIAVGAIISLSSTFLFRVEDIWLHRIQVLLLAGFISLVFTLIFAFDRPFHGDLAVDAGPYAFVREQLMSDGDDETARIQPDPE